jgi:hypothetical protein
VGVEPTRSTLRVRLANTPAYNLDANYPQKFGVFCQTVYWDGMCSKGRRKVIYPTVYTTVSYLGGWFCRVVEIRCAPVLRFSGRIV